MSWILGLAHAGSLTVTLDVGGEKATVEMSDIAACEASRFEQKVFPDLLEVGAVVTPRADGELLVSLDLQRRWNEGKEQMKLSPVLVVADGGRGEMTVRTPDRVVKVVVSARGFAGQECPGTRSRAVRTEVHREE